jgi:predicted nucleic acid-binding protein
MKEERYYPDTSIWIDLFENRGFNGEIARKFFKKIVEEDSLVLISNLHIKEFKNFGYTYNEIVELFSFIKNNAKKIHIYREEKEQAKKLAYQFSIPHGDALHALLAKNNEAQLISRDNHFQKIKHIIIVKKPEDFL